jgi:hypothetical protein
MGSPIDVLDPRTGRRRLASILKLKLVLAAALVLCGASAAPAKDGGPPTIDIAKNCRAAEAELKALFSNDTSDVYSSCVSDEQAARDQLAKDWASYPPRIKATCVQTNEYLLSYVEWQSCIEMTQDVVKMRKEASKAVSESARSGANPCPVVKTGDDGNIISLETRCGR